MAATDFWRKATRHSLFLPVILLTSVAAIFIGSQLNASTAAETDPERVQRLRENFACPECDGQSVAESNAAVASNISRVIETEVAAGATDLEIRNTLLDGWGQEILLNPAADGIAFWVWLMPILVLLSVATVLIWWLLQRGAKERNSRKINTFVAFTFMALMLGGASFGLTRFTGERGVGDALTGSIDRSPGQQVSACQNLANTGQIGEGIRCLDDLLVQDPQNSALLANKGWFFALTARSAQDPEQIKALNEFAIENLDQSLELRPSNRDALAWRAVALFWQDDLAGSCTDIENLYQLSPDDLVIGLTQSIADQCS